MAYPLEQEHNEYLQYREARDMGELQQNPMLKWEEWRAMDKKQRAAVLRDEKIDLATIGGKKEQPGLIGLLFKNLEKLSKGRNSPGTPGTQGDNPEPPAGVMRFNDM